MKKHYRITALVIAMAIVLLCGIRFYMHSASRIIYRENAAHLQESYVQVSKALTILSSATGMFCLIGAENWAGSRQNRK